jgi:alkylation response protein AidB-like acyl-CoA dehydrogenase
MQRSIFEPEHDEFRSAVATFCDRTAAPNLEKAIEERVFPRDVWRQAGEQGFLGLEVPEEFGGSQADDYRFNMVFAEELAKVSMGLNSSMQIHFDICAPYLVDLGTTELKTRLLPDFAAGEKVAGIGMTEAGGGTDLAALKTTAVRDGDNWIINGSKTFITNGYTGDIIIVAARTSPEKGARGISLFVVEEGMQGFERGRKLEKTGQHESDTAELFFNNVSVPGENLLGEVDSGFIYMMERLPQERIGCAISNLAHAKQAFLETVEYAKEREAFGKPIIMNQAIAFKLANMITEIDASRLLIWRAAWLARNGGYKNGEGSMSKYKASETAVWVTQEAIQILGGNGYTREFPVERWHRDAKIHTIFEGTSEIQQLVIARAISGMRIE